jgi:hypothetical protein
LALWTPLLPQNKIIASRSLLCLNVPIILRLLIDVLREFGDERRVRKKRSKKKKYKLGRPWIVEDERIEGFVEDEVNHDRKAPLQIQEAQLSINLSGRALQRI